MLFAVLLAMFASTMFNIGIWVAFVVLLVLYLARRKSRKANT